MSLFDECVQALSEDVVVASQERSVQIFDDFCSLFPITTWGRVDWDQVSNKTAIPSGDRQATIEKAVLRDDPDMRVYILWDDGALPVLEAPLRTVLAHLDDVTAVSFDTWLFSPTRNVVIEFYHEGPIILGRLPPLPFGSDTGTGTPAEPGEPSMDTSGGS